MLRQEANKSRTCELRVGIGTYEAILYISLDIKHVSWWELANSKKLRSAQPHAIWDDLFWIKPVN